MTTMRRIIVVVTLLLIASSSADAQTIEASCSFARKAHPVLNDYGARVNVYTVGPGRNGVASPLTHAGCELA
jgi:hypothetical protein